MLTAKRLMEMLLYNPATGVFTWRVKPCDRIMEGAVASNPGKGYIRIGIDGKRYPAHRLAWLYMTGAWPVDQIDHRNGVRSDNRWSNLREADSRINNENKHGPRSDNRSGYLGVVNNGRKFVAYIKVGPKVRNLGTFDTALEAHKAYLVAKRQHHKGCTI